MRPQVVVALLLLGSLLFLGVRGATRYVQSGATGTTCAVDDQCGSIAEAIAVAASGDTIQIGSGDFSGAGTNTDLAVAKNLAFVGNSSTETFISGGGSTASAFTTSTGVEVSFSAIGFKGFTSSVLALAGGPQATVSYVVHSFINITRIHYLLLEKRVPQPRLAFKTAMSFCALWSLTPLFLHEGPAHSQKVHEVFREYVFMDFRAGFAPHPSQAHPPVAPVSVEIFGDFVVPTLVCIP
jgi:hypothetical protein